jgi:hypothetical protein
MRAETASSAAIQASRNAKVNSRFVDDGTFFSGWAHVLVF